MTEQRQTEKLTRKKLATLDLIYISMFVVLIAICSWIAIPAVVPFTLQTFAVFLTCGLLGWKRGLVSVLIYLLMGSIGLPVFSNFQAGFGVLLGPSGGYLIGFVFTALTMGLCTRLLGSKTWALAIAMLLGLLVCYAFGTAWFMLVYGSGSGYSLAAALALCVLPFILPDLIKISIALLLVKRLRPFLK